MLFRGWKEKRGWVTAEKVDYPALAAALLLESMQVCVCVLRV